MTTSKRTPPYFKLAIGYYDHPKVAGLHDSAIVLHGKLIDYAARHKTDGVVPLAWARQARGQRRLTELIDAGLVEWAPGQSSVQLHGYLEWQTSRERQEATSKMRSQTGRLGGRKSPGTGSNLLSKPEANC